MRVFTASKGLDTAEHAAPARIAELKLMELAMVVPIAALLLSTLPSPLASDPSWFFSIS